jgi:hypothetical protein
MSTPRELLPVEMLVPADARRCTVAEHENFRRNLYTTPAVDEIDLAAADIPNPPQARSKRETARVLTILDNLDKEGRK